MPNSHIFNRSKLKEAVFYVKKEYCKAHNIKRLHIYKFLDRVKANRNYVANLFFRKSYREKFTPNLKEYSKLCEDLGLNPHSFLFNSRKFDPRIDIVHSTKFLKLGNSLSYTDSIFFNEVYKFFMFLKDKHKDINITLHHVHKKYAVILVKLTNQPIPPCIYFYLTLYSNNMLALFDKGLFDLNKLTKNIIYDNFSILDDALANTYNNIITVEKTKYKIV